MEDNKQFWSGVANIYERAVKSGEGAKRAYAEMEKMIVHYLNKEMQVLELAAGPGILSYKISEACSTLEATDFSAKMIEAAQRRSYPENIHFAVADATKLKYKNGEFDAVIIANALHIMPEPEKALKEIARVLKKDGILIAPTFIRENVKSKWIERLMETVGFKTYSRWTDKGYQSFLAGQGWKIYVHHVIKGHNFPISFIVCKAVG